ncbi:MAG TPA: hypothetical protein VJ986_13585 [Gaiellaceae bacterium]|nr:hypothetical protein [Gaiellaceae bacterium]
MARAAVRAKQQQQRANAQPAKARKRGRRGHASGGNPNQELFFERLRRHAKWAYVALAVLFAVTFAFLGVGSGSSGLSDLFTNLNLFHKSGTSLSAAIKATQEHPKDPKGFRELATAYEAKGDTGNAITALQQYSALKPKDGKALTELGGLQLSQAQTYVREYQAAAAAQSAAAPSRVFLPTGTLGTAIGTNPIEQAASNAVSTTTANAYQRAVLAYQQAVASYQAFAKLRPRDANAQFQLAMAAQSAGQNTVAVSALKAYLKLNPASANAAQVKQLIKQLSPAPATPAKPKQTGK